MTFADVKVGEQFYFHGARANYLKFRSTFDIDESNAVRLPDEMLVRFCADAEVNNKPTLFSDLENGEFFEYTGNVDNYWGKYVNKGLFRKIPLIDTDKVEYNCVTQNGDKKGEFAFCEPKTKVKKLGFEIGESDSVRWDDLH